MVYALRTTGATMSPAITDVPGVLVGHAHDLEALTGCTVLALLGDSHVDPDVSTEVFVLDRRVGGDETSAMFAV